MRMQFTSQQLTTAAVGVLLAFIALSVFLSNYTPKHLVPDRSYSLPQSWRFRGLVPPRGAQPAVSNYFLALTFANKGHSFETTEGGVIKQGICFSHRAEPEVMQAYFDGLLSEADYTLSGAQASGRDAENIVAVWNSEFGNISVILADYDGRYELMMHYH